MLPGMPFMVWPSPFDDIIWERFSIISFCCSAINARRSSSVLAALIFFCIAKDRVLHLINSEGQNGSYAATTGLKSLAGELGVTHEALYRTLAVLEKAQVIRRAEGVLVLMGG